MQSDSLDLPCGGDSPDDYCCACHLYVIVTDPAKIIESVEFDYTCRFCLGASACLCADGVVTDSRYLTLCPCRWKLNRNANHLKLVSNVPLCPECMKTEVVYQETPTEWVSLAPGEFYPLPVDPDKISKITFEAKTDTGMISQMTFLVYDNPLSSNEISQTPRTIELAPYGGPYSIEVVSLKNTGSSTVYIRNLTTE